MKTKKIIFGIMGMAVSCFFMASSAVAVDFAACNPNKIGTYGDEVRVQVTNCVDENGSVDTSAGMGGWMVLNSTGTDQQMATILTAMSLGKTIGIGQDGSKSGDYVIVKSLILKN